MRGDFLMGTEVPARGENRTSVPIFPWFRASAYWEILTGLTPVGWVTILAVLGGIYMDIKIKYCSE